MHFLPFLAVIGIVGLDQLTKIAIQSTVKHSGTMSVIDNLLALTYTENRGAAFGILKDSRWVFITLTTAVVLIFLAYLFKGKDRDRILVTGLTFIVGGGIGNLIDRIALGYVVDFIHISFFPPVFNVADIFVVAGTILVLAYVFFVSDLFERNTKKKVKDADE